MKRLEIYKLDTETKDVDKVKTLIHTFEYNESDYNLLIESFKLQVKNFNEVYRFLVIDNTTNDIVSRRILQ